MSETNRCIPTPAGFLMVLHQGDDVFCHLETLMREEAIPAAVINGIGFARKATFGFFDFETKTYLPRTIEDLELMNMNMTGTLAWKDGEPTIHAHGTADDGTFRTFGGYLLTLEAGRGSLEISVTVISTRLERVDPDIGANVSAPQNRPVVIGDRLPSVVGKISQLSHMQVERAQELLVAGRCNGPLIVDVASACNLSRSHFIHAFKRTTGRTPHRWLQEYRIRKAKQLMKRCMPLAEIALECGFADQSHFTRVFSKMAGSSPGAWRRQNATIMLPETGAYWTSRGQEKPSPEAL